MAKMKGSKKKKSKKVMSASSDKEKKKPKSPIATKEPLLPAEGVMLMVFYLYLFKILIESNRQSIMQCRQNIQSGKETFKTLHEKYVNLFRELNNSVKSAQADSGNLTFKL